MNTFNVDASYEPNQNGYDSLMYWPPLVEYYCHSDFVNFGFWEKSTRDARQASENLMEKLLAFVPDKRGNILDVACGKGATTRYLLKYYAAAQITAVNISARQLETCRQNLPDCRFLQMDAVDLNFADASFDTIICVESAFHFNTREKFLHEALRVLKPNGRLVLSDILLIKEAETRRPLRIENNFVSDLDQYVAIMRRVGFTDIEIIDATVPCFDGAFWHLVQFSHEKLLAREMSVEGLRHFVKRFFAFVPEITHYLLASAVKPA